MSLLLCRREFVKHPFYIEILGIYIYSSQELCYVICNHPLLVMDGFVDKALFGFVKNELGMGAVAGRMEKLSETGSRPEEVLYLFLAEQVPADSGCLPEPSALQIREGGGGLPVWKETVRPRGSQI